MDNDIKPPVRETPAPPPISEPLSPAKPVVGPLKHRRRFSKLALGLLLIVLVAVGSFFVGTKHADAPQINTSKTPAAVSPKTAATTNLATTLPGKQLDTAKQYGNKYSNGVLPVGDGKYSATTAAAGTVYTCSQYAHNLATTTNAGAGSRGPWFTNNNTQYDLNKKAHVNGSVMWQASFTNNVSGSTRTIVTNDLPTHPTGIFPIASTDPAYAYDRNPNHIAGQTLTFALNNVPTYGSPNCVGGQVGIILTGVVLFSAFDAGGRDAGAWEVQDSCAGHPEKTSEYHYHTLSSCIKDISVHTVIGYALDGFPITGPQVGPGNILTTGDLDECHGLTSSLVLDGKTTTMYHYVMTQDFPYSISCFRSTAINPPGMPG